MNGLRLAAALGFAAACGPSRPQLDPMSTLPLPACPALVEPSLVFESGFWLNLHNFLFKEAKRRAGADDDGPGARGNLTADTTGTRPLDEAERGAWDAAVEFYWRDVLAHRIRGSDSVVIRVNDRLAASPDASLEGVDLDARLAATLTGVAPIYRAIWWPLHHAHNEAWIAAARQLVQRYGGCLFPRVRELLQRPWPPRPIMIHASTYASWFGAYSSTVTGPRVTLSTNAVGNQETYALEAVLHESVHAGRLLETVDSALAATGTRRGAALEPELSHAILFYTTGELLAGLIPTHVPYAERFGFWTRNRETTRLKEMVADAWRPYVAGSARLADAVDAMVRRASSR